MTNLSLDQRFAIIAGASDGWGPQVAARLADRGMGLLLLGSDTGRLDQIAEKLAGKAREVIIRSCEPGAPGELRRVIRDAKPWLPEVDAVVCNAAPLNSAPGSQLRLDEVSCPEFARPADAVELAREFLPAMIRSHWGRVVFLAPRLAERDVPLLPRTVGGRPPFCELTQSLSTEVGRSRATVNTIAQSWARPQPTRACLVEQCRCRGLTGSALESVLTAQAVAMRLVDGGDVPLLVEYLLSTDGGRVNGLMIPVASEVTVDAVA